MEKRGNDQRKPYNKYADIDNTLKNIGKKIWEDSTVGCNKVSIMAEHFSVKTQDVEPKLPKSVNMIFIIFIGKQQISKILASMIYKYFHLSFIINLYIGIIIKSK